MLALQQVLLPEDGATLLDDGVGRMRDAKEYPNQSFALPVLPCKYNTGRRYARGYYARQDDPAAVTMNDDDDDRLVQQQQQPNKIHRGPITISQSVYSIL